MRAKIFLKTDHYQTLHKIKNLNNSSGFLFFQEINQASANSACTSPVSTAKLPRYRRIKRKHSVSFVAASARQKVCCQSAEGYVNAFV